MSELTPNDRDERRLLERAIDLANEAHRGQLDLSDEPHILHCLRVMLKCRRDGGSYSHMTVAVLHDVIEDTNVKLAELNYQFPYHIACAVDYLSKREDEKYFEYIDRLDFNEIARFVKLRDLEDNMDPHRITYRHGMYSRYAKAYWRLKKSKGEC